MRQFRDQVALVLWILITCSLPAFAQGGGSAALRGLITDSSGSVVPGAKVQATNIATGVGYTGVTTDAGQYSLPSLPPDSYNITVDKFGFERVAKAGVVLHVADAVDIDFVLTVGSVSQTVTVAGGAPLLDTTSSSLGGLVQDNQVSDLPLNGRNYLTLTLMQPGVVTESNSAGTSLYVTVNGAPVRANNTTLDGAIQENTLVSLYSTTGSTLGLDGISEYRVITNSPPAEYGLTSGSQTVIVSKSGTNQFHGAAFDYLRNSDLDAANFFDSPADSGGRRLPEFIRNNFGAAFGGPIKKDKLFFFGTFEGLSERKGITTITNTLGAGCQGAAGATITNTACPQLGSTASVTIAPVVAPLIALYPAPNLPNNELTFPYTQPVSEDYGQMRVDYTKSDADTIFMRYTVDDAAQTITEPFPEFLNPTTSLNQSTALGESHIFSPELLNTARFSYSRTQSSSSGPSNLIGPQYSAVTGQVLPNIVVSGLTTLGPPKSPQWEVQNVFTYSDDVSSSRGLHSLKFGTLVNRFQQDIWNGSYLAAQLSFNGGVASLLQGETTNYTETTVAPGTNLNRYYRFTTIGLYAQDSWRVRPSFTLNYGLRYEPETQVNEAHGRLSTLIDPLADPSFTVGSFLDPTRGDVSPRLGLAWVVTRDGKTVVHAGASIQYDLLEWANDLLSLTRGEPPFSYTSTLTSSSFTMPLTFPASSQSNSGDQTMDYNMKALTLYGENVGIQRQLPFTMALTVSYAGSRGVHLLTSQEANPNLPQALAGVPEGLFWPSNTAPRNPNWGSITEYGSLGDSSYNALQVSLVKQMTKGLQFQSNYTWSRMIDDVESAGGGGDSSTSAPERADPFGTKYDRAVSNLDLGQVSVSNFLYSFPSPREGQGLRGHLLGGWATDGILTIHSGVPFTLQESTERSRSGVDAGGPGNAGGIDRPDFNPAFTGKLITGGLHYYNPAAYMLQPVGTLGNVPRNSLYGPGLRDLDFSIRKMTNLGFLGEKGSLEFRAEIFNLLNHPNFYPPAATGDAVFSGKLTDVTEAPLAAAGVLTNTGLNTSRQVQLSLRLSF